MSDFKEQLLKFGFTQKWMDFGFLTEESLHSQAEQQLASGDSNHEHLRYTAFKSWIRGRISASDGDISNFADLALSDPDRTMAGSALADLIDTPWITDDQFGFLAHKLAVFGAWTEKRIFRSKIIRELDKGVWNPELFENVLAQKDRSIHARLILHPDLSRSQLERLAEHGATRGIRAKAGEALKSGRFRNSQR